jgi:hypothetical protein
MMRTMLRVRPTFLRWLALFLVLPVALHATWDYIEARRLHARVSEITAKGEPVSKQQLMTSEPLHGDPARSPQYLRAAAPLAANWDPDFRIWQNLVNASAETWSPEQIQRVRSLVSENRLALELMDRAMSLPFVNFPAGLNYPYQFQELWQLWRLASLRTKLMAAGRDPEVAGAFHRQLKLREAIGRQHPEPIGSWFINDLLHDVRLVLEAATTQGDPFESIASSLAHLDRDDGVKRALLLQRAELLAGGSLHDRDRSGAMLAPWSSARRPIHLHALNRLLDKLSIFIAEADQPWPGRLDRYLRAAPRAALFGEPPSDFETSHVSYAADTVRFEARELGMIRAARVAVAVERYRRQRGALPSALDALIPTYLPLTPIDPYSGAPVKFALTRDGYVAYSVGRNRKDDGGKLGIRAPGYPEVDAALDIGLHVRPPTTNH